MKKFALALAALGLFALAADAQCYRTSAVFVQQQAFSYAPAAPQFAPADYCAPAAGAAFAVPTYYTAVQAAPVYRTYVPRQAFAVQRQFDAGYGYGGGAVQQQFRQRGFGGGFGRDVGVGGGGGGPISNIIRAVGDVANSPAGQFTLGAFVGNGFKFKR